MRDHTKISISRWQQCSWLQPKRGRRVLLRAQRLLLLSPLLSLGLAERHLAHRSSTQMLGSYRPAVFLLEGFVFLLLLGWGWWVARQPRPSGRQEQRDAARRRTRVRLFHLAQGKRPWHAHRVTQWVLALLGLGFVLLGLLLVIQAVRRGEPVSVGRLLLGISSTLGGAILLLETVLVLPRRLRKLSSQSATLLKVQLLAGEYERTEIASQQEENPEAW